MIEVLIFEKLGPMGAAITLTRRSQSSSLMQAISYFPRLPVRHISSETYMSTVYKVNSSPD